MIAEAKKRSALKAINAVLVLARSMAYEGKSDEVATVLDVAEYLPLLMLEPVDRTEEFRGQLLDLAQRFPHSHGR
ncbi:hypothetical protein [Myxococcus landrumensis]|uniref:hypothetical protein n=1 Tax=Myxococcus landrumensis TaxID=2813577 RepID=UPI001F51022B|nr:hypothetical protein [Myxococcus landrumus]